MLRTVASAHVYELLNATVLTSWPLDLQTLELIARGRIKMVRSSSEFCAELHYLFEH